MCGHNMVLSFLVQDPHLAKADLPHIEESASDVIHCHPKGSSGHLTPPIVLSSARLQ